MSVSEQCQQKNVHNCCISHADFLLSSICNAAHVFPQDIDSDEEWQKFAQVTDWTSQVLADSNILSRLKGKLLASKEKVRNAWFCKVNCHQFM